MTALLWIGGAIIAVVLFGIVYTTVAANFVASHQDRVDRVPPLGVDAFMRALQGAAGDGCAAGCDVTLFQNGDEIFPPMLDAIRSSRSSVHFSSYIFWSGNVGERFAQAFGDAARRGVTVRLVVDSEGSRARLDRGFVRRLREAGCHFAWYHSAKWYDFTKYNRRTHRRILVVDGIVAFTGGAGVADPWRGNAANSSEWRDTHARVTGAAVRALQAGFTDSWNQSTEELLLHERDFPALAATGDMSVTAVVSTPSSGSSAAQRVMAACVAAATRTLHVTNAYFVPTPAFVDALRDARSRGVQVVIIVPGPYHNKPAVRRASRHTWHALMSAGVEIHEFQPTMVHAKTLIVDGQVSLVGSINFDPRSFSLNAECGIVVASERLAVEMERVFAADLARSRQIEPTFLRSLSAWARVVDAMLYWLRAQL